MTVKAVLGYLRGLSAPRYVLWCYLIWWCGVAIPYFEPDPRLWLTSVGMSLIIGFALLLSVGAGGSPRGLAPTLDLWSKVRLFIMPFCVSSFAALVKGRGFFLVVHPDVSGNSWPLAACAALGAVCLLLRRQTRGAPSADPGAEVR